jgi:hypothetical protein
MERNMLHDQYSQGIARITEYHNTNLTASSSDRVTQMSIEELRNGLFIQTNLVLSDLTTTIPYYTIAYNIFHGIQQSVSGTRLMEIISFGEYEIINQNGNVLEEEYLFSYNAGGRLENIYAVHNWGNVPYKSIYYDGQLRELLHPFFNEPQRASLTEIIIFENDRLKYHFLRRLYTGARGPLREDFLTNDEYYISILIEFNANENQIKHTYYFPMDGHSEFPVEYMQFDTKRNWTLMKIGRDEYKREIIYR